MQTYVLVKNRGNIVVTVRAIVSGQFGAHIQYMGHCFVGLVTYTAFDVFTYSMYMCVVILSVQS